MFNKVYRSLALLGSLLIPLVSDAHSPAPTAHSVESSSIEAIWRVQHINLRYQSFTTRYSCQALERKVTDILQAIGAHVRLVIDSGCAGAQLTSSARLSLAVASPVTATPENVARATMHDGRTQLVARVRNISLPQAADLERFPAQWQDVRLTSQHRRLTSADCDLIAALNEQVFPHLTVRLHQRSFSCPSAASRVRPHIVVTALRPTIRVMAHLTSDR